MAKFDHPTFRKLEVSRQSWGRTEVPVPVPTVAPV